MNGLVAEIDLEHALLGLDDSIDPDPGEPVVVAGDVLAEIAGARAAGARALLVSIDSCGGEFGAGIVLYDAFRSFSEAGGSVVVYVADLAASAALWPVLAADYVVAAPHAAIWPHGVRVDDGGCYGEISVTDHALMVGALLRAHTLADEGAINRWVGTASTAADPGGEEIPVPRARELGFVDFIGDRIRAAAIARDLALGTVTGVSSPRREGLAARGVRPDVAQVVRDVRAGARAIAVMRGWPS